MDETVVPRCKYCGAEGYSWCCPDCYKDFETDRYEKEYDEPEEDYEEEDDD